MRIHSRAVLLTALALPLAEAQDPSRLQAMAASGDPALLAELGKHLGDAGFLNRLDPPPGAVRLGAVFRALAEHPSPETAALCLALAKDPEFVALPARLNLLLPALAAVHPVSADAANLFLSTSRAGFLEVNVPLLARNASPRALAALTDLMADDSLSAEQRIGAAHWGIMPNRLRPGVAEACAEVLRRRPAREIELAILESLFDYRPREWFGRRSVHPKAPPWDQTPATVRNTLKTLGQAQLRRGSLPLELDAAIRKTLASLTRPPL